jgi:hypothetical protein
MIDTGIAMKIINTDAYSKDQVRQKLAHLVDKYGVNNVRYCTVVGVQVQTNVSIDI